MINGLTQAIRLTRSTLFELLADARWANRSIAAIVSTGIGVTCDLLSPVLDLFGWLVPVVLMLTLVGYFLWERARTQTNAQSISEKSTAFKADESVKTKRSEELRHRWAVRTVHSGIASLVILPLAILHLFVDDQESLIIGLVQEVRGDVRRVDEKVDRIADSLEDTGSSIKGFELSQTLASSGGQGKGWPQKYELRWPEPYRSGSLKCRLADNTSEHVTFVFELISCRKLIVDVRPQFKANSGAVDQLHWSTVMTGLTNNIPYMVVGLEDRAPVRVALYRALQDLNGHVLSREDLFEPLAIYANLPVNPVTGQIRPLKASADELQDMLGLACSLTGCGIKIRMISNQICMRKPKAVLISGGVAGDQLIDLTTACAKPLIITTKCFKVPTELKAFAAGTSRPATLVMEDGERFEMALPVVDDQSGVRCS